MPHEFRLPDLGEGVQEGEIVRWLVAEGDTVQEGQELVEVMTDKVTAALPSRVNGRVVRLHGRPGDVVPVNSVLVTLDTAGAAAATPPYPAAAAPKADPAVEAGPTAVPAVRRLARELGVALEGVSGTGPGGRILEGDVRAAARPAVPPPAIPAPPAAAPASSRASAAPPTWEDEAFAPGEDGVRRVPLRGLRRAIAEHLLDAHRNTAPYTFVEEADFTELVRLRERVQPLAQRAGARLTYLPFIIAAVSMALRDHPYLNATVEGTAGDLLLHREQHVGIAVHTEGGLVVPVIRHVERRKLLDLARELDRLSTAAREGRLSREDVLGGTITISSLGAVGGILGTPMLNTPQVAVLGVHKIAPRAVVRDGAVVPRQVGNLSLTLDHRYIDGYIGARFTEQLVRYLEDPALMLFWLAELRES